MERRIVIAIAEQMEVIFFNMEVSMKTCDRDYLICGVPVWRYFYHTIHSCDKWFINPNDFQEPEIHTEHFDKVDLPCYSKLSDQVLWEYFTQVREKVVSFLSSLCDENLYEKPPNCNFTRMELILGQYRHFSCHIGIFNGITVVNKNKFPLVVGLEGMRNDNSDAKLFTRM